MEIDDDDELEARYREWLPVVEIDGEQAFVYHVDPAALRRKLLPFLQLAAIAELGRLLDDAGIAYWLFGGWAVDFYVGSVTRPHDDVDVAVWLSDAPRIAELLERVGWRHAPHEDDDGGTGFERGPVRLELTFLVEDEGRVFTPLCRGPAAWPAGAFTDDVDDLRGVRARLLSRAALAHGKSAPRDDPDDAAKDRADADRLSAA